MELSVTELPDQIPRLFLAVIRDLAEQRRQEAKIGELMLALEKKGSELEAVLDKLGIGVCVLDPGGAVRFFSNYCRDLFLRADPDVLGLAWSEICPLSDDVRTALTVRLKHPEEATPVESSYRGADGRTRHFRIEVLRDVRDARSRLLLFYDITETVELRQELQGRQGLGGFVGRSAPMQKLYKQIEILAEYDTTVLITGETGTGKELVARALHDLSRRSGGRFVAVNTAGLTDSLIASQFFGHARGAFTGAVSDHKGIFEAAQGGTVFLDEIGDLPLASQASLLRVLQEKEIVRVGESLPRKVDVRVLAATHRDLGSAVQSGRFREDLYYRLKVATIRLPALRERIEDIPILAQHFVTRAAALQRRTAPPDLTREVLGLLTAYPWPGNVRELQNVMETALLRSDGHFIDPDDLSAEVTREVSMEFTTGDGFEDSDGTGELPPEDSAPSVLALSEMTSVRARLPSKKERLLRALELALGNRTEAARQLGIGRTTLYRWSLKYGVPLPDDD
jgi:DNA-binding NtrC family response regulator